MGKRLENLKKDIEPGKLYSPQEAIELAVKTANTKFVGNIEVHVRLGIDVKKSDQTIRSTVTLPHGSGKSRRVAAFVTESKEAEARDAGASIYGGEELIKKIKDTGKIEFDVAVAEPAMMPKLAQVAKILGPKGLMPNPKTGSVTNEIGKAVKEFSTGKLEFKNDDSGNVHIILGKTDFETSKLVENFKAFLNALNQTKPGSLKKEFIRSLIIHATMGPSIKIKISG